MSFDGRSIIVTGGASGMGAATVRRFAAERAHVTIVDRDEKAAAAVSQETGADVRAGDVSDSAFCDSVVRSVVGEYGFLDVLVNAAGVIHRADALGTDDAAWTKVLAVNVDGVFFMSRAAIRPMKEQGWGAIVNFGSIWGDIGAPGVVAYCAAKGAVHQITKAMALDHADDGIRINAVAPGEIDTPMLRSERAVAVTDATMASIAATVPTGRLGDPDEVAAVVHFLASDQASYMTGSIVTVDAGYSAR